MEREAVVRSALWAAYGDALGFITELTDVVGIKRRVGESRVTKLVPWTRRVGGRFGVNVTLPAGCYSDDTQLRLATSRAIRFDGDFDVEAFAQVELPIWKAYALGAGRGSKAAAQALSKPETRWMTNFFDEKGITYINGGGNGAAMRIQPHVWSSPPSRRDSDIVRDIVRNAITTHGHPRGIVGAIFHALCLRRSLRTRMVPGPNEWKEILDQLSYTSKILAADEELQLFWVPQWERQTNRPLDVAFRETLLEVQRDICIAERLCSVTNEEQAYADAVESLDAFSPAQRGSATKTAVLAAFLAFRLERQAFTAIEIAANLLQTDTDTIATMAGALLGATATEDPPEPVADIEYIKMSAERLHSISQGLYPSSFSYPDLLSWSVPKTELDAVGKQDGTWVIAGLGKATPVGEGTEANRKSKLVWQWFELEFGQRVLLKHRADPSVMAQEFLPFPDALANEASKKHRRVNTESKDFSIDEAISAVHASNFDRAVVGEMLIKIARSTHGVDRAAAFAGLLARDLERVEAQS